MATTRIGEEYFGLGVAVVGLRDTQRALKIFAPEVGKAMDKRIKAALEPIVVEARSNVPDVALSGWGNSGDGVWESRLGWDAGQVRKGIKVRKGGGTTAAARRMGARTAYRIVNQSPAGAVFELAGRRSSGRFQSALNQQHGIASRLIWDAWDRHGGKGDMEAEIERAVRDAEDELQRVFDRAMGG